MSIRFDKSQRILKRNPQYKCSPDLPLRSSHGWLVNTERGGIYVWSTHTECAREWNECARGRNSERCRLSHSFITKLKALFPKVRIAIIQKTATRENVLSRALKRAEKTGRLVPEETILSAIESIPALVYALKEHANYVAIDSSVIKCLIN